MEKYNFRFVNDPENQNKGLTIDEINSLKEKINLKFPQAYIYYLQKAGKNSNVFNVETNSSELKKIQGELRSELDNLKLLQDQKILCIKKNLEEYYFFNLSENKTQPTLYVLKEICINEAWEAYQKTIEKVKEESFLKFINAKTDKKYGLTIKQHVKNIPVYMISVPITIILMTVFGIEGLKENFKSRIRKS